MTMINLAKSSPLLLLTSMYAVAAQGQNASSGSSAFHGRIYAGALTGRYDDISKNDEQGIVERQGNIKLTGEKFSLAGSWRDYELQIEQRNLRPKDVHYWDERKELLFDFAYIWPQFKYVMPVLGYHQLNQVGDRNDPEAPSGFIKKNNYLNFGLRTNFIPYVYNALHGVIIMGHVQYLTTLEKKSNFGTESMYMGGYVYQLASLKLGLVAGQIQNFFNASVADKDNPENFRHVRHTYHVTTYGLYIQY